MREITFCFKCYSPHCHDANHGRWTRVVYHKIRVPKKGSKGRRKEFEKWLRGWHNDYYTSAIEGRDFIRPK